jgi:FGGY-family pentulose kinase
MEPRPGEYVIGVDVGTGSARAGVFALDGRMLAAAAHPIQLFRPRPDHVEHASADVWQAVGQAVRRAVAESGVDPTAVVGLSFDATCSLVALDADDRPVSVALDGDPERNVVVWMDHRAQPEADAINRTRHPVLDYVGGRISPEMEPPKLRWLKTHFPERWARTARFFDLADFLVYAACGEDVRSLCTVVCKWTYLGHEGDHGRWDEGFFAQIGLGDLVPSGRAGRHVRPMGSRAGGLTPAAAGTFGLPAGTTVGVGIIDAHAGGIGSLGLRAPGERAADPAADLARTVPHTLALIGGTSSCHMTVSAEPRFIPGVWGPYYGAMLPGMWLTEGGQSATGALVDHVIANHADAPALARDAAAREATVYEVLNDAVAALRAAEGHAAATRDLHVLPDFHGNRSPRADSHARGMVSGLTLDSSRESLARLYCATVQAVAYGTRHILDALERGGYRVDRIHASGGGTKNPLWLQEHADVTGRPVYVARDADAVLLGAAVLAAVAAGRYGSILEAMAHMSPVADVVVPDASTHAFHDAKYEVFLCMYDDQQAYRCAMAEAADPAPAPADAPPSAVPA